MHDTLPELSIFFPFWNEEKNVKTVVEKTIPVAQKIAKKWEIIMVDDGSSDKTYEIAASLAEKDPAHLRVVRHHPNRGYGAALREGFQASRYRYVVFNDGDNQFNFAEIVGFIPLIKTHGMVVGYRTKRNDHNAFKRLLLMNLLKIWDFILFRFYFRDIDCGFKMFTRETIQEIMPLRSDGAMITTEILAKAKRKGIRIAEVGVTHYKRRYGAQTGANFAVIMRAVLESFILWYDLHYGRA